MSEVVKCSFLFKMPKGVSKREMRAFIRDALSTRRSITSLRGGQRHPDDPLFVSIEPTGIIFKELNDDRS